MAVQVSDREFQAVTSLPGAERYEHLIKRVADTQEIWSLRTEAGWVLAAEDGRECVPVWPHPRYAAACAVEDWLGSEPAVITLDDWLDEWLPTMESDGRGISGFPTPDGRTVLIEPAMMRADLEAELEQYE
jgi:hypothetical protein